MGIVEVDKLDWLLLLVLLAVPGFIARRFFSGIVAMGSVDEKIHAIESGIVSMVLCAIASPVFYLIYVHVTWQAWLKQHPFVAALMILFALIIYPALAGTIFGKYVSSNRGWGSLLNMGMNHPTPRAWDFMFSAGQAYWVRITLIDGTQIAGLYVAGSFASNDGSPENADIYVGRLYSLKEDKSIGEKVDGNWGFYVPRNQIKFMELHPYSEEPQIEVKPKSSAFARLVQKARGILPIMNSARRNTSTAALEGGTEHSIKTSKGRTLQNPGKDPVLTNQSPNKKKPKKAKTKNGTENSPQGTERTGTTTNSKNGHGK